MGLRKVLLKRLRECRDFRALSAYIESVLVLGDETARYLHQLCIAGKYPVTDETLDTLLSIRELYCVFIMKVCAEMDRYDIFPSGPRPSIPTSSGTYRAFPSPFCLFCSVEAA